MDEETKELLFGILNELKSINSKLDDIKFDTGYIETHTSGTESELQSIQITLDSIDRGI